MLPYAHHCIVMARNLAGINFGKLTILWAIVHCGTDISTVLFIVKYHNHFNNYYWIFCTCKSAQVFGSISVFSRSQYAYVPLLVFLSLVGTAHWDWWILAYHLVSSYHDSWPKYGMEKMPRRWFWWCFWISDCPWHSVASYMLFNYRCQNIS